MYFNFKSYENDTDVAVQNILKFSRIRAYTLSKIHPAATTLCNGNYCNKSIVVRICAANSPICRGRNKRSNMRYCNYETDNVL